MKPIILYDNRYLDGTPVATDTAAGFDPLYIRDLKDFTYWQALNGTGTKHMKVNCGAVKSANCLAVFGHNFGTVGADISVESSNDDFVGNVTERLAAFSPANDKAILKNFTSANDQHWRMKMASLSAAPKMAVAMIGTRLEFPRYISGRGQFSPREDAPVRKDVTSQTGHRLEVINSYTDINIEGTFQNIDPDWVINNFEPFWNTHAESGKPFFWVWNLDLDPTSIFFVCFDEKYKYRRPVSGDPYNLQISLRGVKE